jgi:hypothetical protein
MNLNRHCDHERSEVGSNPPLYLMNYGLLTSFFQKFLAKTPYVYKSIQMSFSITNNIGEFQRVEGLNLENWLE